MNFHSPVSRYLHNGMQVVNDLTQTQIFDKENGVGLLHKLIKVNNITVSSVMGPSDTPVHLTPPKFPGPFQCCVLP